MSRTNGQASAEQQRRRWRPVLHPMPSHGWLNDPCGPGYDPHHRLYHLGFQWNPDSVEWGNISWGTATSVDLVHWTISEKPSMSPTAIQDQGGVFTGCMLPTGPDGHTAGLITALYTSVKRLPIHYTLPYVPGSELVCMATSADSGKTWNRDPKNTSVISRPPCDLDVVGWRDPFVAPWPALDQLLKSADRMVWRENTLYGLLSGGIRGQSPTTFLYRINGSHLDHWEFIAPLLCPGLNFTPSPRWAVDFGANWEVANFLTLQDSGTDLSANILICSVEGRNALPSDKESRGVFRATHGQMWLCGILQPQSPPRSVEQATDMARSCPGVEMVYQYGGTLDHGALYSANSFWDPPTGQHIMFGWILEEDLPLGLRRVQGWAGTLSFPRVLYLGVIRSVVGALSTPLHDIGTIGLVLEPDKKSLPCYTVTTLCSRPDPRLECLRRRSEALSIDSLVSVQPGHWSIRLDQPCAQFELKMAWHASRNSQRLGFQLVFSEDERTVVYFEPRAERVVIDRSQSTCVPGVVQCDETAPHTLFSFSRTTVASSCQHTDKCTITRESLTFHVYFDYGVLELFVNERTMITTRVYPGDAHCQSIKPFLLSSDPALAIDCFDSQLCHFEFWDLSLS